ncbi:MAG: hypothetical protein FWE34_08875 [Defluviitaleaceae bacterium]|nr:hypothetical protein [Defluviitaleaceae bacterium]
MINKIGRLGILVMMMLALGIIAGCSSRNAYDAEDVVSILFVGNSHVRTGNIPRQLQELAGLHGIEISYVDVSINGSGLDGALRDNAIREMQNRNFDYVVMQQPAGRGGRITADVDSFFGNIRNFAVTVRENGAIPVLYSPMWMGVDGRPNEEFHNVSSGMFKQAAYENDAILVDVGGAWVYVFRAIPNISLYARDGMHANHAGAFLAASVFMATLFDLDTQNIPEGNIIDNLPMLNIITIAGFVATLSLAGYRFAKKQDLHVKKSVVAMILFALLQVMSFFPHVFIFTESGNRILLLYSVVFVLLMATLYSIYRFIRIVFVEKRSWGVARRYLLCVLICGIVYGLTFIPAFELRSFLYRGDNAFDLAQVAWNFLLINSPKP